MFLRSDVSVTGIALATLLRAPACAEVPPLALPSKGGVIAKGAEESDRGSEA